jgi:hypothetical protein
LDCPDIQFPSKNCSRDGESKNGILEDIEEVGEVFGGEGCVGVEMCSARSGGQFGGGYG